MFLKYDMHTSKVYGIHGHTCYLIIMEGIVLMFGKMKTLGTGESNVLSASKVNTLSLFYILSPMSFIFSLKLL